MRSTTKLFISIWSKTFVCSFISFLFNQILRWFVTIDVNIVSFLEWSITLQNCQIFTWFLQDSIWIVNSLFLALSAFFLLFNRKRDRLQLRSLYKKGLKSNHIVIQRKWKRKKAEMIAEHCIFIVLGRSFKFICFALCVCAWKMDETHFGNASDWLRYFRCLLNPDMRRFGGGGDDDDGGSNNDNNDEDGIVWKYFYKRERKFATAKAMNRRREKTTTKHKYYEKSQQIFPNLCFVEHGNHRRNESSAVCIKPNE